MLIRRAVMGLSALVSFACASAHSYGESPAYYRASDGTISSYQPGVFAARFEDETSAYAHAVLGDSIEYRTLALIPTATNVAVPETLDLATLPPAAAFRFMLPPTHVFEDLAPRPVPLIPPSWAGATGDLLIRSEMVAVVEADMAAGAALALYGLTDRGIRKVAAAASIGRAFRWLAPAGIDDFDGDGQTDIAYVETPHLAGILKIVTLRDGELVPIVDPVPGFSNHKIGQDFITSGVRRCLPGDPSNRLHDGLYQKHQPELLLPNLDHSALIAVRVEDGKIITENRPEPPTRKGIEQAQRCAAEGDQP